MPFPLAHPAAVLPLRRFCPRWLSFPALFVGSFCPDLGYVLSRWGVEDLTHRIWGGFLFSIPVGLLFLAGLALVLRAARTLAPSWFGPGAIDVRPAALPGRGWGTSLLVLVLSLAVGTATHLAWDSFTHRDGWLASQVPWLKSSLLTVFGRRLRLYHVLWYLCSIGGAACIADVWLRWRERALRLPKASATARVVGALLLATLVVPIAAAHHLIHGYTGNLLAACLLLLVMVWLVARSRPRAAVR